MPDFASLPGAGKPGPDEWEGDIHVLTVRSVTPPEGQFGDGEMDYDIGHPPSCEQEDCGYDGITVMAWTCDVAAAEQDCGLASALRYSGTPVTEPGTYRIRAWGNRTYYHEWGAYEYDGGVAVVEDEEA